MINFERYKAEAESYLKDMDYQIKNDNEFIERLKERQPFARAYIRTCRIGVDFKVTRYVFSSEKEARAFYGEKFLAWPAIQNENGFYPGPTPEDVEKFRDNRIKNHAETVKKVRESLAGGTPVSFHGKTDYGIGGVLGD